MDERNYCVYIHINKTNNKVYIGMTGKKPTVRWNNGSGYKKQLYFYNAIQLYGWNGFYHEIIKDKLTLYEASELEKKIIQDFNSTNREKGYNIALGGYRGKISESGIQNMKKAQVLRRKSIVCLTTGQIYNSISDAQNKTKLFSSNLVKNCKGERRFCGKLKDGTPLIWRYYEKGMNTKISKEKAKEIGFAEIIPKNHRIVVCLNTKETFLTISQAERKYNIYGVRQCCVGKYHSSGEIDGVPLQWMFYEDWVNNNYCSPKEYKNKSCSKVICLNNKKVFNTMKMAEDEYGICYQSIVLCCKNHNYTTSGRNDERLKWMYYEDYIKNKTQ